MVKWKAISFQTKNKDIQLLLYIFELLVEIKLQKNIRCILKPIEKWKCFACKIIWILNTLLNLDSTVYAPHEVHRELNANVSQGIVADIHLVVDRKSI